MANLEKIQKYLQSKKLPYKVIDLGEEIFTVKGVAGAGINEDEIVKTLIIRSSGEFWALAIRGNDRLDFKKVRKIFGNKSELAKPNEVLKVCGVTVGAVCPVLVGAQVVFDKNVMKLTNVHMGSGDLTKGLEMKLDNLLKAVGSYKVEDLV